MAAKHRAYQKLIKRVRKIDPLAADYLVEHAPHLESFIYSHSLLDCFIWNDSPQRRSYWYRIAVKLDLRNNT